MLNAQELSGSFNSSRLNSVGVFVSLQEAKMRGELSARKKFQNGCTKLAPESSIDRVVMVINQSILDTRKQVLLVEGYISKTFGHLGYPVKPTLLFLQNCNDVAYVKVQIERAWLRGEIKGFTRIRKEMEMSDYVSIKEYTDKYFGHAMMVDLTYLKEFDLEGTERVQRELLKKCLSENN